MKRSLAEIEARAADPTLWNEPARAQAVLRERTRLTSDLEALRALEKKVEDAEVWILGLEVRGQLDPVILDQ